MCKKIVKVFPTTTNTVNKFSKYIFLKIIFKIFKYLKSKSLKKALGW